MIKILVLDDERGVCKQIEEFFERRGYRVFGANRAEEAIEIIKKESPKILLLDIKIPGENLDGLDVLREAKAQDEKVKVIMVTGLKDEDTKIQALELGVDEYIVKPFNFEKIESLVIRMVNEVIEEEAKDGST